MKKYDLVVIGSGCGAIVSDEAVGHGKKAAVIDKGPLGGTCLNLGCIPSKMLIYAADRAVDIQESGKLGIKAEIGSIDFASIMERMRKSIKETQEYIRKGIKESKGLDFYEGQGHFVGDYTLEVNGQQIKGEMVCIACGSRPFVPPIKGCTPHRHKFFQYKSECGKMLRIQGFCAKFRRSQTPSNVAQTATQSAPSTNQTKPTDNLGQKVSEFVQKRNELLKKQREETIKVIRNATTRR